MLAAMQGFIRGVDAVNYRLGRVAMYGIFVLMGILLWSSISKTFFLPTLWTLEMAQFVMVGYYILGGPYSLQLGSNVRMDLLYGDWSIRRKAWFDAVTVLFLIFYLCVLLYGAVSSTAYSLGYWKDAPFSFLAGVVVGTEEVRNARTLGLFMASIYVADQSCDDRWFFSDAAAMRVRVIQRHLASQTG